MSPTLPEGDLNLSGGPDTPGGFERRPSRIPLLILGIVVLGIFFAVGYGMFTRSVVYYRTPTEVMATSGTRVRVAGTVVDGSIRQDGAAGTVRFSVTDTTTTVTVLYRGPMPDTLKDGADAVAEGSLEADGIFHADTLFAKCPSKFQAKDGT